MFKLLAIVILPEPLMIIAPVVATVWLPLVAVNLPAVCSHVPDVNVILRLAINALIEDVTLLATPLLFKVIPLNRVSTGVVPLIVWVPTLLNVTLHTVLAEPNDISNVPLFVKSPPMERVFVNVGLIERTTPVPVVL